MNLYTLLEDKKYKAQAAKCLAKYKKGLESYKRTTSLRNNDRSDFPGKDVIVIVNLKSGRVRYADVPGICEDDGDIGYSRAFDNLLQDEIIMDFGYSYWKKNQYGRWEHYRKATLNPNYDYQIKRYFEERVKRTPEDLGLKQIQVLLSTGERDLKEFVPLFVFGWNQCTDNAPVELPVELLEDIDNTESEDVTGEELDEVNDTDTGDAKLKEGKEMSLQGCMDAVKAYMDSVRKHKSEVAALEEERVKRKEEAKTVMDMGLEQSNKTYEDALKKLEVEFEKQKSILAEKKLGVDKAMTDAYDKTIMKIEVETTKRIDAVKIEQNVLREEVDRQKTALSDDAKAILEIWLQNFDESV